jgi:hypothetical protein
MRREQGTTASPLRQPTGAIGLPWDTEVARPFDTDLKQHHPRDVLRRANRADGIRPPAAVDRQRLRMAAVSDRSLKLNILRRNYSATE